uniref:Uncharacterized protein n=1 Tax=Aegilops tauschii subsp. strangulata TaxID=200361 RepID=A0A453ERM9_AEGTS
MTGSGREAPLLRVRKVYHERCPGCRQERKTQADHRIPYTEFLYIWIACLCAGMMPHDALFYRISSDDQAASSWNSC